MNAIDKQYETYASDVQASWLALLAGLDALTNAAYTAYTNAIEDLADYIHPAQSYGYMHVGDYDEFEATPENEKIINAYWQAYVDLCHVLHSIYGWK